MAKLYPWPLKSIKMYFNSPEEVVDSPTEDEAALLPHICTPIFSPFDLNFLEQPVKIQQNKLYNSKVLSTLTFFMAPCHWVMFFFFCAFVK